MPATPSAGKHKNVFLIRKNKKFNCSQSLCAINKKNIILFSRIRKRSTYHSTKRERKWWVKPSTKILQHQTQKHKYTPTSHWIDYHVSIFDDMTKKIIMKRWNEFHLDEPMSTLFPIRFAPCMYYLWNNKNKTMHCMSYSIIN